MDLLVENLFADQRKLDIPGFLIRSTAPRNVEEDSPNQVDRDQPTIQDLVEYLYQASKASQDLGIVIAIHGYNTGVDASGKDGVVEGWYQPLCTQINQDRFIHQKSGNLVFLGYRWPSESMKQLGIRQDALRALPLLLSLLLYGGIVTVLVGLLLTMVFHTPIAMGLSLLGVIPFAIILSLYFLRISLYFRDTYRASHFGVPDLLELIRRLDQGLIQRKVHDALTDEDLCDRITQRIAATRQIPRPTLVQIVQTISQALQRTPDLELNPSDTQFQSFIARLRPNLPLPLEETLLTQMVERIAVIEGIENDAALRYWRHHSIQLSFLGHSMGGHVTTQVIRILSDIFDPRSVGVVSEQSGDKAPSSRVGRVFRLGRLILVAPDIPVLTITSGRSNFLRSALRRFEEAYLFSNEGDLALRIASTAANYFSFPAKTRTQGYRLGNVTVSPKSRSTLKSSSQDNGAYGILNLHELSDPHSHLLEYLEINVLSKDKNQKLDPASQRQQGAETVASSQVDREAIADLFTYFDCTEYRDFTDYNPTGQPLAANVLTLDGQRSPLRFWAYLRLFVGFASFTPGKFPKGGRDVHGGYFAGQFCKLLLYRLAFLGLQGLLDSLIETTPDELGLTTTLPASLEADLARVRAARRRSEGAIAVPGPSSHNKPPQGQPDQRRVALTYLSWLLEQKRIQAVFSPERYQVEVLGRDRNDVREGILTQTLPPTQR